MKLYITKAAIYYLRTDYNTFYQKLKATQYGIKIGARLYYKESTLKKLKLKLERI